MQLPEKIKHPQEVWIPAIRNITNKLKIPVGQQFSIDDSINAVKNFDPEVYEAYVHVMNTYEAYSLYYHALKRKEPGTFEELKKLEEDWITAETILNKMVDYKSSKLEHAPNYSLIDKALEKRSNETIRRIKKIINHSDIPNPWLSPTLWHIGYSNNANGFLDGEYGFYINMGSVDLPQAKKVVRFFVDIQHFKETPFKGGDIEGVCIIFVEYKRKK